MNSKINTLFLVSFLIVAIFILVILIIKSNHKFNKLKDKDQPYSTLINQYKNNVTVKSRPKVDFQYDIMRKGVKQHVDRNYTYDYIPKELKEGLLLQGIHRTEKGTSIKIKLFQQATIYFFFHSTFDGGYGEIFKELKDWKKMNDAPKYDIYNGDHGLNMVMYKLEADKGIYHIPSTKKEQACFNIVFKFK